jgi:hypothetical protein
VSNIYVLAGSRYNLLARAVAPFGVGAALAGYDPAWACDGDSLRPLVLARGTGSNFFSRNLNQVVNPDFEDSFVGNLPGAGWAKSATAVVSRVTSTKFNGNASMQVDGPGQNVTFDLPVAAGETLNVFVAAKNVSTSSGLVFCRNLSTGNYLQVDGNWGSTANPFHVSGIAWSVTSKRFIVESFAACGEEPTLRWTFQSDGSSALFDTFFVWPRVDFVSFHGHNLLLGSPVSIVANQSDPITVGTTTMIAFPSTPHVGHVVFPALDLLSWTFSLPVSRADGAPIYVGEVVLGQRVLLSRRYDDGIQVGTLLLQDRSADAGFGQIRSYVRAAHPRRKVAVNFRYFDQATFDQMEELLIRSRNGADPLVFVHDSADAGSAALVRVDQTRAWKHVSDQAENRAEALAFEEMPMPNLYSDDI